MQHAAPTAGRSLAAQPLQPAGAILRGSCPNKTCNRSGVIRASCQKQPEAQVVDRRSAAVSAAALAASGLLYSGEVRALGFQKDMKKARRVEIPESEYKDGPEGLKYYDVSVGSGPAVVEGQRVAVHYDARWHGITFITTRQGLGVTGGEPVGFDVGAKGAGGTLPGLDLGVRGMRQGGQRKLIAYGNKGVAEIPPNATLQFDVSLLSIKRDAIGFRTKVVEG